MIYLPRQALILSALGLALSLAGCGGNDPQAVQPDDFAQRGNTSAGAASLENRLNQGNKPNNSQSNDTKSARAAGSLPAESEDRAENEASASATTQPRSAATATSGDDSPDGQASQAEAGPSYAVGGMVGQVNGQAIYAHQVFKPLEDQLSALGRKLSRAEFRQRAKELIRTRLRSILADRLIFGEAMRNLKEREQKGLSRIVEKKREELLRKYGRGAEAVAAENLRQETGQTLSEALEDFRRKVVVQRYMKQKLFPRVSVSKQDIKHYYRNHPEKFQPGVQRKIRLIRVDSEADAKKVKKALKAGKSFKAVAGRKLNSFNRSGNGLLGKQRGERPLQGPLNKVLVELDEGEWGGPASFSDQYWFVFVESMTRREGKSLREVQLKIRNQLRSQRFRQLQQQYRRRLFKQGSFGSIKQMGEDLLRIAMSRYAPPPPES